MLYEYRCENCDKTILVSKPMNEVSKLEFCDTCKEMLIRLFSNPSIKTSDGLK